jgi:hypothetical protein
MSCYLLVEKHVTEYQGVTESGVGTMKYFGAHLEGRGNAHAHRAARGSVAAWVGRDGHSYGILFVKRDGTRSSRSRQNDALVMGVHHELELGKLCDRAGRRQTPLDADPGRRASSIGEDGIEQDARWLVVGGSTARELDEKTLGNEVS